MGKNSALSGSGFCKEENSNSSSTINLLLVVHTFTIPVPPLLTVLCIRLAHTVDFRKSTFEAMRKYIKERGERHSLRTTNHGQHPGSLASCFDV